LLALEAARAPPLALLRALPRARAVLRRRRPALGAVALGRALAAARLRTLLCPHRFLLAGCAGIAARRLVGLCGRAQRHRRRRPGRTPGAAHETVAVVRSRLRAG